MTALCLIVLPIVLALAAAVVAPCQLGRLDPARRLGARPVAGVVRPGDDDWFRIRLPAGVGVELTVRHAPGAPIEPPEVFASRSRGRIAGRAFRASGEVGRRFVTPRDGPYRIRVRGGAPGGTAYRLRYWTEDP